MKTYCFGFFFNFEMDLSIASCKRCELEVYAVD